MVEIVTTGYDCRLLSDPEVDVTKSNHFRLTGPGFVSVSILGMDISVNGLGEIIAPVEFATKTGLQPSSIKIEDVELTEGDRVYQLTTVSVNDGNTRLTLKEDL